jgi:uncharacterized protein
MTDFQRQYSQWGLVAGAAEGLGASYCTELAKRGMNVIMVDVKKNEMESLSKVLEDSFRIKTRCLVIDLAEENAAKACMEAVKETDCRLLIYNAAYSRVKPFLSAKQEELDLYINVNTRTPLKLVHLFTGRLKDEGKPGGVLLMSSLAGLWGTRLVASYSGTKGFNLLLAEALSHELRKYHIHVGACCAGATATPGYLGTSPKYGFIRPSVMKPGNVAAYGINKIGKKTVIIPGFSNRMTYFFLTRLMPRSLSAAIINRTMEKTYQTFS